MDINTEFPDFKHERFAITLVDLYRLNGFTYEYPGFLLRRHNGIDYAVGVRDGHGCTLDTPVNVAVAIDVMTEDGKFLKGIECDSGLEGLDAIEGDIHFRQVSA